MVLSWTSLRFSLIKALGGKLREPAPFFLLSACNSPSPTVIPIQHRPTPHPQVEVSLVRHDKTRCQNGICLISIIITVRRFLCSILFPYPSHIVTHCLKIHTTRGRQSSPQLFPQLDQQQNTRQVHNNAGTRAPLYTTHNQPHYHHHTIRPFTPQHIVPHFCGATCANPTFSTHSYSFSPIFIPIAYP